MSEPTERKRRWPVVSGAGFTLIVSLALVLFYNHALWADILGLGYGSDAGDAPFLVSLFVALVALLNLALSLIALPYLVKSVAILIVIATACVAYFMDTYGVMIDRTMVQNVMETDAGEVRDLLGGGLALYIICLGLMPAWLIYKTPIRFRAPLAELKLRTLSLAGSAGVIGLVVFGFYQDYASLFRNHGEVRYRFAPYNYIYATTKYYRHLNAGDPVLLPIGEDAARGTLAAETGKKAVLVLVVGETARAQNFSLNGYSRPTNPYLSAEAVVNFEQAYACGTATAVSVPCMFSYLKRDEYSDTEAKRHEGLLDVLAHAGVRVLWKENNSGCKGVCDRAEKLDRDDIIATGACKGDPCYDEWLLQGLDAYLESVDGDAVIVLHQNGSHGPAYYRRYPQGFEHFTPVCRSAELQNCSREEVVNSYDNTILYTDHFLGRVIALLKQRSDRYDTAMIYMSDHGESLGEHNLYLHGLPYFVAPEEQKHVPLVVWLSQAFARDFRIDASCLAAHRKDPVSHDNLFHSVLGLLDVQTRVYDPNLDIFAACRSPKLMQATRGSNQG